MCCLGAFFVMYTNGERQLEAGSRLSSKVVLEEEAKETLDIKDTPERRALILYSPQDELSAKYEKNLKTALKHLRFKSTSMELARTESVSYEEYDVVILASGNFETEMKDSMVRLINYVKEGGALFWGVVPNEVSSQFQSIHRNIGISDYGDYIEYSSMKFKKELLPGIAGMSFKGESFADVGISVNLEDKAEVYASVKSKEGEIPVIWKYKSGRGNVVVFNGTGITGDFWRGVAAGCINSLFDAAMYPVINSFCLFIDDFPSPQYESTSDVVRAEYNRSVKEFYRDIWWPDMQKAAKKYGDVYTGLFVATYNRIVEPERFTYEEPSMEQYFGNSLLKNGYEMGAHGYNHQSLTLAGGTPESMDYKPWADTKDMASSIEELDKITERLFPSVNFRTYVPPSNYLSREGREAVKKAIPDLEIISGIYTDEGEEGEVYVQDFQMAEDGIAEFPRITSGMMPGDFEMLETVSAAGLYGVFSHFIHPDDIFDEDRGKNQTWEMLYGAYCEMIDTIHKKYPFMRSMTAVDAAKALKVSEEIVPYIEYRDDRIKGSCDHFYGEAYFYLRTDKHPQAADDSCSIERIDPENGAFYYIVTVKEANFTIELVEE